MDLLVLGPQGAGKGTQAKRVEEDYAIPHIATGDIFREEAAAGSEFGLQVKPLLDSGRLVPDELTVALIRERLGDERGRVGFVLDGFPRNPAQADALDDMLAAEGRRLDAVFFFDLPDDVATERMLERAKLEGRSDDTPEVIARRLATYHEQTKPLVERYRRNGVLITLHAERTIPEVYAEIREALGRLENGAA